VFPHHVHPRYRHRSLAISGAELHLPTSSTARAVLHPRVFSVYVVHGREKGRRIRSLRVRSYCTDSSYRLATSSLVSTASCDKAFTKKRKTAHISLFSYDKSRTTSDSARCSRHCCHWCPVPTTLFLRGRAC
jgi:hypothetical protein